MMLEEQKLKQLKITLNFSM